MTRSVALGMLFAAWCLSPVPGLANEWDRFRGPNGSGVVEDGPLPVRFGPDHNVVWSAPVPPGYSSPVLTAEAVVLTGFVEDRLLTISIDRSTGRERWRRAIERPRAEPLDPRNHPAAATPAVDGEGNVYVFFGDFGLVAYDAEGGERWRVPLGPFNNVYGMGASPIVVDDLVILACDQQTGSFLLAVDRHTGREHWRTARPEARSGHASPILWAPPDGPPQVLVVGSFLLTAYEVSTGERRWWVGGLPFEMKSTPVIDGDTLYVHGFATPFNQPGAQLTVETWSETVTRHDADGDRAITPEEFPHDATRAYLSFFDLDENGALEEPDWSYYRAAMASLNGLVAIRLGGTGDRTDDAVRWRYHRSVPQLPSPLLYEGVLYMVNDGGIATSLDPGTGDVLARGRFRGAVDDYYASPIASDGKLFFVGASGVVVVVGTDGDLGVEAINDLGSPSYATPAVGAGRLYVRTEETLWAFGPP